MQVLTRGAEPERFFPKVSRAARPVLLLDYDGTLAPFRVARDEAVPWPGVRERLRSLLDGGRSRVVIISGRYTEDLIPLLGLEPPLPELWGSHGWERRRPDGAYGVGEMEEEALRGLAEADRWVREEGWESRSEEKPGCLALHTRGLDRDEAERVRRAALAAFRPLARRRGLRVHEFDGGVELRVPGRDKGDAVRTILEEEGLSSPGPDGAVAYLGDDRTDEDAFEALDDRGLAVLVRRERRPTAADLWIRPPEELLEFLERWDAAASGDPGAPGPEAGRGSPPAG